MLKLLRENSLNRHFPQSIRNIGYLLHPSISRKLSSSPSIADVGTGTGRFLCQLAESYPEATLQGFDISSDLFPAPETLPSNVKLGLMDVKQPPPSEEHGRYDVVHVRLLVAAMNPEDWEVAVRYLSKLLKPGGALQWEENDFTNVRYYRGGIDSPVAASQFMSNLFRDALFERFSHGWNTLPQIMEDAGLVGTEKDVVSSDRIAETRAVLAGNGMVALFGWARMMAGRGVPGSRKLDELKQLEGRAFDEIKSGCYVRYDVHIALAFKAD